MSRPVGGQTSWVHYAESRAGNARALLAALLEDLSRLPGFRGAELLSSPGQPGLYLLASRWAGERPEPELPGGVRAWTFVVEASR